MILFVFMPIIFLFFFPLCSLLHNPYSSSTTAFNKPISPLGSIKIQLPEIGRRKNDKFYWRQIEEKDILIWIYISNTVSEKPEPIRKQIMFQIKKEALKLLHTNRKSNRFVTCAAFF